MNIRTLGIWMTAMVLVIGPAGCYNVGLQVYEDVFDRYYATTLGVSTSADVLATLQSPDADLLSQSESVIAAWGKKGDPQEVSRTHWFNMVAFDEEAMTAVRKYGFILEETTRGINRTPKPALRFDAAVIMGPAVLDAAFPSSNARRIAAIEAVQDAFIEDAAELTYDSATLTSSTLMVRRAFNNVLNHLRRSPAYADHLARPEGMAFDHMTLGESYIRLLIEGDIVKVKIKAGEVWFEKYWLDTPFEEHPDVQHM